MRFLLVVALAAVCTAQAQVKPMTARPPASADDRDERNSRERDRQEHRAGSQRSTPPMMIVRPPTPPERDRDDERRWRERDQPRETRPTTKMAPPASKPATAPMMVVRPEAPVTTPPSKAEQMQRRMEEQRRRERGEVVGSSANFHCNAHPVCDRSSGSYGTCRGVDQMYSAKSLRFAREQVARDCAALNTPDPCRCAAQCSRVAQCGPI